jgi:carbamoyltransferase
MGEVHAATVYHARKNKLKKLHEISALHSIGILYSLITLHLGFDFNGDDYIDTGCARSR